MMFGVKTMIRLLFILFIPLGLFFVFLGMLFINYELSPLKKIVDKEYVYKNNRLGVQIMLPGLILMVMSCWIIYSL